MDFSALVLVLLMRSILVCYPYWEMPQLPVSYECGPTTTNSQ